MTPRTSILDRRDASSGDDAAATAGDRARPARVARNLFVGIAAGAVLYLVFRRSRRLASEAVDESDVDVGARLDSIRDDAESVTSEASPIPIGVPGTGDASAGSGGDPARSRAPDADPGDLDEPGSPEPVRSEGGPDEGGRTATDEANAGDDEPGSADGADAGASGEESADAGSGTRLTDEERTTDELDELATEDVRDEPAEPGELSVDEEIVEDVAGEESREDDEE